MTAFYRVVRIDEPDYGCEGLPEGGELIDEVTLRDEQERASVVKVPDRILTERKIGRNSLVVLSPERGMLRVVRVAAAVIEQDGKIFAARRGYGKWKDYWEFPGGKIEPGETPEDAVRRELREELAADIGIVRSLGKLEYDYPDSHLSMDCFLCRLKEGGMRLLEHEDAKWLAPERLPGLDWLPADRDFVEELGSHLSEGRRRKE